MFEDFAKFFLEEDQRAAFFSAISPFGTTPGRRRFLSEQFPAVVNRFHGALGEQARQGLMPDLSFGDFTGNFDFNRLFQQQPRFQRGASSQLFNPKTRFLFGF